MPAQRIIITPLPNGIKNAGANVVKLSVAISLQVLNIKGITNGPQTTLVNLPDMHKWAALINKATFFVQVNGVDVAAVKPSTTEGNSAGIDTQLWEKLFTSTVQVRPFVAEATEMLKLPIRSYPVKYITEFVEKKIAEVGLNYSDSLPVSSDYTSDLDFVSISPYVYDTNSLMREKGRPIIESIGDVITEKTNTLTTIRGQLNDRKYVPFSAKPSPEDDFAQLRLFHGVHDSNTAQEFTTPTPPDFDFHDILSVVAAYPQLLRRLGLVVDLEFTLPTNLPADGELRVLPGNLALQHPTTLVCPAISYTRTPADFFASSVKNCLIANGYLLLNKAEGSPFTVYQLDVDGAGLKMGQMIDGLQLKDASKAFGYMTLKGEIPDATALQQFDNQSASNGNALRKEGLPAQRTAGIGIAHNGLAGQLHQKFDAAKTMESLSAITPALTPQQLTQLANPASVTYKQPANSLFADDVVLGYRMDVREKDNVNWYSLHSRKNEYRLKDRNSPLLLPAIEDEGFIQLSAAQGVDNGQAYLKVGETIARWEGWSLSVPRPGKAIKDRTIESPDAKSKNEVADGDKFVNPATVGFDLQVTTQLGKGKLPRLRFGRTYTVRLRTVDLAGNSVPLNGGSLPKGVESELITYQRYEPVATPILVMGNTPVKDGESIEQVVISSQGMKAVRHVKPPRTHVQMAEQHGLLDEKLADQVKAGQPLKAVYDQLAAKDRGKDKDPKLPKDPPSALPYEADILGKPAVVDYLVDPMAAGVTFFVSEFDPNLPKVSDTINTQQITFYPQKNELKLKYDTWMDPQSFKIRLVAANALKLEWIGAERTLEVGLQPGFMLRLSYSCFWWPDDVDKQSRIKEIFEPELKKYVPELSAKFRQKINQGRHWMISPWRDITFVHAVQRPIAAPVINNIQPPVREAGSTSAGLAMKLTVHSQSTDRVDIESKWMEWVDDINREAPTLEETRGHVSYFTVNYGQNVYEPGTEAIRHLFGDTKHRMVDYRAIATTRYREYFTTQIAAFKENPDGFPLTVGSVEWPQVNIPSSARPLAPDVAYVIPSFEWGRDAFGPATVTGRATALRVYLRRPWYSSGEGEQLAVVLFPEIRGKFITDDQVAWFTTWGTDPTLISAPIAPNLLSTPGLSAFIGEASQDMDLSMAEGVELKANVVVYNVKFDEERRLYYVDIMLNVGFAYTPFIRLAVARYQPHSLKEAETDCRLSPITLTDYIQLPSPRTTSLQFNGSRNNFTVATGGIIPRLSNSKYMNRIDIVVEDADIPVSDGIYIRTDTDPLATDSHMLEKKDDKILEKDKDVKGAAFTYEKNFNPTANKALAAYTAKPFRIRIMEYELIGQDPTSTGYSTILPNSIIRERLVFAEVYEVGIGSPLTAYTTGTTHHIVYRDHNNKIQEVSGNIQSNTQWFRKSLMEAAKNDLPVSGNPFGQSSHSGTVQHVAYRRGFNICELQQSNGPWSELDITKTIGAPQALGNVSSYITAINNNTKIVYRNTLNKIIVLWSGPTWQWANLSDASSTPASALPAGDPWGYLTHNETIQRVVYRDQSGHLQELSAGNKWVREDLTMNAKIPAGALAASDPIGYTTNNTILQRVIYTGQDGHVHELWRNANTGWNHGNLTLLAGVSGSSLPAGKLSPYVIGNTKVPHIVYRGQDNYIHVLWVSNGVWTHINLTLATAGASRPAGDPVGYVSIENSVQSQNVVYYGSDGHLHRLSAGVKWTHSDLGTV